MLLKALAFRHHFERRQAADSVKQPVILGSADGNVPLCAALGERQVLYLGELDQVSLLDFPAMAVQVVNAGR